MAVKLEARALRALPRQQRHSRQHNTCCVGTRHALGDRLPQARCASSQGAPRHPGQGRPRALASPALVNSSGFRRTYVSGPPQKIAVVGGGITGLTTAYYLSRFLPESKITLYESGDRLGGWLDTEVVDVRDSEGKDSKVHFERGARTILSQQSKLKWDDLVLYELIDALDLRPRTMVTEKSLRIPRYVYYPDHMVDVTGPYLKPSDPAGTITSLLSTLNDVVTEPVFKGLFPSLLRFAWPKDKPQPRITFPSVGARAVGHEDLSIGEYFQRRFGRSDLVDNLISAIAHGTQGGDVWKLSMGSSMFHRLAIQDNFGNLPGTVLVQLDDVHLLADVATGNVAVQEMAEESNDWSYISFDGGLSTLTDAIAAELRKNPNVKVLLGQQVDRLKLQYKKIEVTTKKNQVPISYDKVISTLFAGQLAPITDNQLDGLGHIPAVHIMAVNLWYPTPDLTAPYHGFGYLLPQSVPFAQNPEAALGVLFDSDREAVGASLDSSAPRPSPPQGTKLTVLLGGHYWDSIDVGDLPSEHDAVESAKSLLARHLGIDPATPVVTSAKLCRHSIPQHHVGHSTRLRALHKALESAYDGRLAVAGGSYSPPGVLPSLRAARDVASQVAGRFRVPGQGDHEQVYSPGATGLAGMLEKAWGRWPVGQLPFVKGSPWRPVTAGEE